MLFESLLNRSRTILVAAMLWTTLGSSTAAAVDKKLVVVTTTPNLAALVEAVGRDAVDVHSLARPGEDPHFVEARPSFVRLLHSADLLVIVGLDSEAGYLPTLTIQARNPKIQPGGLGFFDASEAVDRIVPAREGIMARALGDIHPRGNPHYLLDPVEGLRVARRLTERLSRLAPETRTTFEKNYLAFRDSLLTKLYGADAVKILGPQALAMASFGGSDAVRHLLSSRNLPPGGWEGEVAPIAGTPFVADHKLWPYFARRFGFREVELLEPFPGVAPTARHLQKVIEEMRAQKVELILSSSYFRDQYANKVARETGARVAFMADQVGIDESAGSYIEMTQTNLNRIRAALERP